MRKILTFESVKELSTYENVHTELIDIKPKKFVNFPITSNINFSDNLWVFNDFKRFSGEDSAYSFDFNDLDTTFKNYAKYMILRELFTKQNRFTTVSKKFYIIKEFLSYLSEHHIFYPNLITVQVLEDFLLHTPSERSLTDKKQALKMFLSEIELRIPEMNFSASYQFLNKINSRKVQVEREKGKHKFIPLEIHNKIISLAIQDLRNVDLPITNRAAACMIVLLAETGMRVGEFRILEVNQLEEISVKGESESFYYLNFKTYKTVREKDYKWTRSFITENALLAYKTLSKLYEEHRTTQYLFVNQKGTEVSKTMLRFRLVQFFYQHQAELQLDKIMDHELKQQFAVTRKRTFKSLKFVPNVEMDKDIYYVTFHQYRVILATILYSKGYHLDWIREHMNHLTVEMTQHYIRIKEIEKIELNAVETLMTRSSKDGSTLITSINDSPNKRIQEELLSEEYKEIYEQINNFLKKNKLNIFKDQKEIIAILSRSETPIADMELGICAKSFNKLCERNQYLSSINDAYYLGVQVHSLEDLPYSIKRFQEKSEILSYNEGLFLKNNKYRNEFERELKGIKKYIQRKLEPELNLLKNEINLIGLERLYVKHPRLVSIIKNIKLLEEGVEKWKEKKL